MEQERKKKLTLFIGAIVVGVMFVTSYAAFGSNGSAPTSSTTIRQNTYAVFGSVNAIVTGYGSSLMITLDNKSAGNALNSTLSRLEANNTITNFIPTTGGFLVYATGNFPYTAQETLYGSLPQNSISLNGTEVISTPNAFVLYYYGTAIDVYTNITNFTVPSSLLKPIGYKTKVNVQALVLQDGRVYDSNIQVT